jgi:bla regulator protein BlaR1
MKKYQRLILIITLMLIILDCTGCSRNSEIKEDALSENTESSTNISSEVQSENIPLEIEVNYGEYFKDLEGTAVFYNNNEKTYYIYNKELAEQQSSPCSSFKIISCLMGLESNVIDPVNSTLKWNGTVYPINDWNKDTDYKQAFKCSCIWYYRSVIDSIGKEYIQNILNELDYGNRDISEWEGSLNNLIFPEIRSLKEINGFWQESSLQISPKQQVDVLKRIFEDKNVFSEKNLDLIKEVMLINNSDNNIGIYGKTGSGMKDDTWTDAWFVGFFEKDKETTYFAVRLNQPETLGSNAKEIAVNIINSEFSN